MTQRYLSTDQARQLAVHWARTEPIVRVYIASAIGQHHLVEDIVQDVATIVSEKFSSYDPDQEFARWAIGIARNRIYNAIRSKGRDRHVFSTEMIDELVSVVAEVAPEAESRKAALKNCLKTLNGRTRRIIDMRYRWGQPVQQIAGELGLSRVAVSAVLMRGRKALGDCIEARLRKEEQA
jgi:RNA polymerase sigma-70 factor (ECF subfamily)